MVELRHWYELRANLNDFHNRRRKADVIDALEEAMRIADPTRLKIKGVVDFVPWMEAEIKRLEALERGSPRPAVRPVARPPMPVPKLPPSLSQFTSLMHDVTLHEIMMKEIYDSEFRFEGCTNRHELREFISPENGLREKPYSEFTVAQKNMFFVIRRRYKEWCVSRGTTPRYELIEEDIPM